MFRAGGIESVLCDVLFVSPVIGRKDAGGDARFAVQQIANKRLAVRGESECLADFLFGENWIFKVEAEVPEICAGTLTDGEGWLAREDRNHIRGKRTHLEVSRAFPQFESAHDRVGDHAKTDPRGFGSAAKVVGLTLDDDLLVLRLRNESKGA